MRVGTSYKQTKLPGSFDTIVVGSGIGGLTAAALLARHAGERVLVLERHYTAGGFTHVFQRPGFEWDVGVHYLGDVHSERSETRRLFDHITRGQLAFADMGEVYDRVRLEGETFDFVRGKTRWRERLVSYFPGEARAIDRYLGLIARATSRSLPFFMEKALPRPLAAAVGPILRAPELRLAKQTLGQVLGALTSNRKLRAVLAAQHGDYGMPPSEASFFIHAMVAAHYFGGGAYPIGGSARLAATIEPLITEAGGMLVTNADVEEILVERGRARGVRLADGHVVHAPRVISDAGVANTVGRLLAPEAAHRTGLLPCIRALGPSVGHLALYLGLDQTDAELGLEKPNVWLLSDADYDGAWKRFRADPLGPPPGAFLSFPSAKDPDFQRRFPGRATVEVVAPALVGPFAKWAGEPWRRRGPEYEALKASLAERLRGLLLGEFPQLAGHIRHEELSTPLSTAHFAAHPSGEIYGLNHGPARFAERRLRPETAVPGLYLTGADIASCGVAGALAGGYLTATAILRRNLVGAALRGRR